MGGEGREVLGVVPGPGPRLGGRDPELARGSQRRVDEPPVHGHRLAGAGQLEVRGSTPRRCGDLGHRGADRGLHARQGLRLDPAHIDPQARLARG